MAVRIHWARVATEHRDQLVVDDLDERLARIEAAGHLLAEGSVADSVDQSFGHRQRDVGLEQRHPNRPDGIADVLFGDPATARDALDCLGEAGR